MRSRMDPFAPRGLAQNPPANQAVGAVTTSVSEITIPGAPYKSNVSVRLVVVGNDPVAFAYGSAAGLTIDLGCYMLGNTVESFLLPPDITVISAISSGAGSSLRVHVGEGA